MFNITFDGFSAYTLTHARYSNFLDSLAKTGVILTRKHELWPKRKV